jgi:acetyltransferase-like isoleucine patch superfamily enzyme
MNADDAKQQKSLFRIIFIQLLILIVGTIGFIPTILFIYGIYYIFNPHLIFHWILLPVIIYFVITILLVSQYLISGLFISIFNIKYEPGTYPYELKNKNAFKWVLVCSLYTPGRKILEIFPLGFIKYTYLKLVGMKIGPNSLVGGVIKDPCVTSFGANTTMGEYAIIYAHIHNVEKGTITIKKVAIGSNCVIGAGAIIMPGVTIEDNVIVAAGALVPQDQILKKDCTYAGIPAKEIKKK